MFCKNCGKKLEDGALFCFECGTKQDVISQTPKNTPYINSEQVYMNGNFVQPSPEFSNESMGTNTQNVYSSPVAEETKKVSFVDGIVAKIKGLNISKETFKKISSHKFFKPACAVIALILVIAIVVVPTVNAVFSSETLDFHLYVKDSGALYVKYADEKEARFVSNSYSSYSLYPVYIEKNGYLFYLEDAGSYTTLSYRDLDKKKSDSEKIDNDVTSFEVSSNGKTVFYMTSDGSLYVSNLKEHEKIAKNVSFFTVNKDGDRCVYFVRNENAENLREAYSVYSVTKSNKPKCIAENVSNVLSYSREKNVVFFSSQDEIHAVKDCSGKAKKVAKTDAWSSDCGIGIFGVKSATEFYYTVQTQKNMLDYVEDTYNASADMNASYGEDGYYRNNIREDFEDETLSVTSLYFVDGSKNKLVSTDIDEIYDLPENPSYVVFGIKNITESGKVNIDKLVSALKDDSLKTNAYTVMRKELYSDYSVCLAVKQNYSVIKTDKDANSLNIFNINVDSDGKYLYYIDGEDDNRLYQKKIGSKEGKSKELFDNVSSYYLTDSDDILTLKDLTGGTSDLYLNKKKVASDVYSVYVSDKDMPVFFYSDYSKQSATLNRLDGKKVTVIEYDVVSFSANGKSDIMYVTDDGDLYKYKKNKSERIDDTVLYFIEPKTF